MNRVVERLRLLLRRLGSVTACEPDEGERGQRQQRC